MFNFSEFCKEKKCQHYKEWHVQAGKDGMVRCCDLIGMSFYVTTFPDNCIHLNEIKAKKQEEREKHETWKKLTDRPVTKDMSRWTCLTNRLKFT